LLSILFVDGFDSINHGFSADEMLVIYAWLLVGRIKSPAFVLGSLFGLIKSAQARLRLKENTNISTLKRLQAILSTFCQYFYICGMEQHVLYQLPQMCLEGS
jgi:hypothetical protein